ALTERAIQSPSSFPASSSAMTSDREKPPQLPHRPPRSPRPRTAARRLRQRRGHRTRVRLFLTGTPRDDLQAAAGCESVAIAGVSVERVSKLVSVGPASRQHCGSRTWSGPHPDEH
nr:hypothetical protein [Tanacetum cinerariifolium]